MRLAFDLKKMVVAFGAVLLVSLELGAWGQHGTAPKPADAAQPAAKKADAATYVGSDACKSCHKDLDASFTATVHGKALGAEGAASDVKGCEACHGPGSAHIANPTVSKPQNPENAKDSVAICGKCHFDDAATAVTGKTVQQKYWKRSEHSRGDISCTACHSAHKSSTKMLKKPAPELCTGCHSDVAKKGNYLHAPVAGGACLTCHDPHGTNARHQLVSNVSEVCVTCHSPKVPKFTASHKGYDVSSSNCTSCHAAHSRDKAAHLIKTKQHMPFKSGQCQTCHKPGSLELVKPEKELCTMCHSKELAATPEKGTNVHAPVSEGLCTMCHSAHASDAPKGLWKEKKVAYSCFMCHSKVETAVGAEYPHKPAKDLDCSTCHQPHMSKEKSLLTKNSMDLCKDCHKPHAHPMGKGADGKVVIDPNSNDMLTCASCHTPHGSDFDKLTKQDKTQALCTTCHKV